MGRKDVGRYLDVLDGSFGAAIASADDIAADDLALSFLQDLHLIEALVRLGPLEAAVDEGGWCSVVELGADYAVIEGPRPTLFRLNQAAYRQSPADGPAPQATSRGLTELLRSLARRCVEVRVDARAAGSEGVVTRAGRDHLAVMTGGREVIFPVRQIAAVVLTREEKWRF